MAKKELGDGLMRQAAPERSSRQCHRSESETIKRREFHSIAADSNLYERDISSLKGQQVQRIQISMKRMVLFFLFIFTVLFWSLSPLFSQENKVRVTAETARIYVQPDTKSPTVETVKRGTLLYLFSTEKIKNDWYRVYFYSQKRRTTVVGYIQISMVGAPGKLPEVIEEEKKPEEKIEEVIFDTPKRIEVITAKATIRARPDIESQIIQEIELKTELQAVGKVGNWYKVNLLSDRRTVVLSGYTHQSFVKEIVRELREAPVVKKKKPIVKVPSEPKVGPELSIGVGAGYSLTREDLYSDEINYGGSFCLGISKNLSIELSGLRFQNDVEGSADGLSKGRLSVVPIQLSIQVRLPVTQGFIPYVLGGGGYYLNSFELDGEIVGTWDALGFDVEEKIDHSFGYHFGAGFDVFISGNIALSANVRYCLVQAKGSWSLTDQIGGTSTQGSIENLNLNTIIFGAGLKFCF